MRAVHAGRRTRRGHPLGPVVVGEGRAARSAGFTSASPEETRDDRNTRTHRPGRPGTNGSKEHDPTLAGTIAATLRDASADRFAADDVQFLKFHGIYQQDDRDLRKIAKKFIFMVRCRIPGGVLRPEQYLACDELATRYANATLRVTSRQGLQFHGVVKTGLGATDQGDPRHPADDACGVRRREPQRHGAGGAAARTRWRSRSGRTRRRWRAALAPTTGAYHAIWVDGVAARPRTSPKRTGPSIRSTARPTCRGSSSWRSPSLRETTWTSSRTAAVSSPIADGSGALAGYVLTAGGGMGRSHANAGDLPAPRGPIGFLPPERVVDVARGVLSIHRDFGDRGNRKHARLKYVLADRGPRWFREELERRVGFALTDPPPYPVRQAQATRSTGTGSRTAGCSSACSSRPDASGTASASGSRRRCARSSSGTGPRCALRRGTTSSWPASSRPLRTASPRCSPGTV